MPTRFNMNRFRQILLRYTALFSGLFIIANGIVCLINSDLGATPWDVLHIGISIQSGISIGRVMQGIGLFLIIVSYFFKVKPNIGTLLNMVFLGLFVDLVIKWNYIPHPGLILPRILLLLAGIILYGFGVAFYISPNLGAGPRDSLMLALSKLTSLRAGTIRTMMETIVAISGYLLGGPLGIGTVIFALSVGLFMELGFAIVAWIKKTAAYKVIWTGK